LSLEWKHYEHDWTDIWYATAAIAIGLLGVVLQFAGWPLVGFTLYGAALIVGFIAAYRMGRFNREA
jgi:hypothetical protein